MSFHSGEIEVQARVGVRAEAEQLSRMIRNTLKPAASEFVSTQRLAIASTIAPSGHIWASLLTGAPGFIQVLDPQTVQIKGTSPLTDPLYQNLHHDDQLGLLVIDLSTRKRLRLNGRVTTTSTEILQMHIQQAFFNCQKYIQTRFIKTTAVETLNPPLVQTRAFLNETDRCWLAQTDTFFIATAHPEQGADVSHRGGYPGFVQITRANKLVFPDYAGNNMFQTLGNLTVNPKAGLLAIDFEQGHTLQLTGQAAIVWEPERCAAFAKAQRLVEFSVEQVLATQHATSLRWQFGEYSPANPRFAEDA